MNAKTIIPLLLLLISPAITTLADAEEVTAVEKKSDFDNPETLRRLLAEAVLRDSLEERGPLGAKLLYAPGGKIPYTGWAKLFHDNDKVKLLAKTQYGKLEGPSTKRYPNGQKAEEATLKDGKLEGPYSSWHENGKKEQEGTYKDDKLEGPATKWHENGKKADEGAFKNGKQEGLFTKWHENGQKSAEGTHKDGKLEGPFTKWHENGQKAQEGAFKDGKPDGIFKHGTTMAVYRAKSGMRMDHWPKTPRSKMPRQVAMRGTGGSG